MPNVSGTTNVRFSYELGNADKIYPENPSIEMQLPMTVKIRAKPVKNFPMDGAVPKQKRPAGSTERRARRADLRGWKLVQIIADQCTSCPARYTHEEELCGRNRAGRLCSALRYQKINFAANCTSLGKLFCWIPTVPNDCECQSVFGPSGIGVFVRLNDSPRNSTE